MTYTHGFQGKNSTKYALARSLKLRAQVDIVWPVVVLVILMAGLALRGHAAEQYNSPVVTLNKAQLSFGTVTVGTS